MSLAVLYLQRVVARKSAEVLSEFCIDAQCRKLYRGITNVLMEVEKNPATEKAIKDLEFLTEEKILFDLEIEQKHWKGHHYLLTATACGVSYVQTMDRNSPTSSCYVDTYRVTAICRQAERNIVIPPPVILTLTQKEMAYHMIMHTL